ncbi:MULTISPECIES: hypothetical protein [unclassified Rathayibacter]|uniref:hypothetical protein n=1 Tax=unclassified Rathayibacter TaxID=2609250 RepID=UPI0006F77977|nr:MULTISPECIES: hypothetical protein [unclassified Rathayibacter]KQQ06008.1 hypothetical protein ASF42_05595 [Rathayibacter sp. Leaf294]KQS13865.1 hypothetical protein ASG06_05605 [Rathayibacter sp. Leaf185]
MTADRSPDPRTGSTPPPLADPRRFGAVIGLVGAAVFVFSYTPGFTDPLSISVRVVTIAAIGAALWLLFARPRFLGPFVPPPRSRIIVYVCCVVAEFALIAIGTGLLESAGRSDLRPALIAAVVGLHFLPFAWAFAERMFVVLGCALVALGGAGLLLASGSAARGAAVTSGVVMAVILVAYGAGAFAPRARTT